jgi:site-specific DNA-methyltransferase (adenine-specific)/adenine-specific DNA-methyltransferase
MTIQILSQSAEQMSEIDQTFDLIYMDPPFGLQRDFKMLEEDGSEKGFEDQWSSFDDYVTWYAEIIDQSWNKLNKNGWMYLHNNFIGNALVLSKVSTNVRNSFYTNISWKRSGPKNNIKNGWGNIVDSIMVIRKGNPYFEVEYTDLDSKYEKNSFKNQDEKGYYALAKTTGEKSRPGRNYTFKGYSPIYGWRVSEDILQELSENNLLHYGKNTVYKKIYLDDNKGVPVQNLWDDIYFISRSEQNKRKYPTQKPLRLLERIVKSSCPVNGWVFDPFCGSGTTALASQLLQRNCITCDTNSQAIKIAKQSIQETGLLRFLE